MKILAPRRIPDFNEWNRNYPLDFLLNCLIHGLWRQSRGRRPSAPLYFANTPERWYTYAVMNPAEAFASCQRILRMATAREPVSISWIVKKAELTPSDREIIMAQAIRSNLSREPRGGGLQAYLGRNYAPWREAVLASIR